MIKVATEKLSQSINLTQEEMHSVMEEIMTGKTETSQIVAFLTALNKKGETEEELTAAAEVMRKHVTRIRTHKEVVLDTCGTGGDRKGTFNVSTIVAFVACGAGITVAKHCNRSVSSYCGSADILEALGVKIDMDAEGLEKCLNEIGIAFLFAQKLHPAMKFAMPARKQIGAKTMFNILGPLTNPAGANHQLVGVYDSRRLEVLARVLGNLGTVHALVVHGEDGLDEITTTTSTLVSEVKRGKITNYQIIPEDFGLKIARMQDLAGGTVSINAQILQDVLNGKLGAQRDIVVLNAAAAIYAADKASSIREGIKLAVQSLDSKKALEKLEILKEYSKR